MVSLNTSINDTRHNTFTSVSLWEVEPLMNLVDTYLLTNNIHLLIHATWEFHARNALQTCNTLYIRNRQRDYCDVTTHTEHLYTFFLELSQGIITLKLNHCHGSFWQRCLGLISTCPTIVSRYRGIAHTQQLHLTL